MSINTVQGCTIINNINILYILFKIVVPWELNTDRKRHQSIMRRQIHTITYLHITSIHALCTVCLLSYLSIPRHFINRK